MMKKFIILAGMLISLISMGEEEIVATSFGKNVNGGGHYSAKFIWEEALNYSLSASATSPWRFIEAHHLSAPLGWVKTGGEDDHSRGASVTNILSRCIADIFPQYRGMH